MRGQKKDLENFLFSVGGVLAMFLLLAGIYVLSHLAAQRVDLTEEKMFTLSEGTKAILKKLDTPVQIRFYSTQGKDMPVELKTYAQRVEDILNEYRKYGGNKIQVKKFDPQPDSDAEDSAALDGVEGQGSPFGGDRLYLGLSVSMLDSKMAIPFLDPRRERLLEYDISRAIANVMSTEKPVVGVMTSLPMFGQVNPMMMMQMGRQQQQEPWVIIHELKRDFEVREIQANAEKIDADVDILMVVHPKNLSDGALYAIDQFIMRGGKVMAFVDPLSIVDSRNAPGNNPLQGSMNAGSSLDKLTRAWGLEYDVSKVLADRVYSTRINRGGGPAEDALAVLSLTAAAVNTNDVVTSQVDNILMPFAGAFTGTPVEGLQQTVLIHSSEQSQLVEKFMAEFGGENILKDFQPSGKRYALAVRLFGKFKSAFDRAPGADGAENGEGHLTESTTETAVVLVADTDLIFDQFVAQVQNIFGQRLIFPMNGNLNLVQSLVEQNAGDQNLIAIRSRATMNRPFTRVREMQVAAEERYRNKIRELETSLEETQNRLNELQQAKGDGQQRMILSAEQQAELTNFRQKQAEVNRELKEVRKDLRREVESLENRLKWLNIAGMPLLVTVAGISLAVVKRKKTAAR